MSWMAGLPRRVGRRGAALLFFAFLDLVYGYSLAAPTVEARRGGALRYFADIAPLWAWAALWIGVGLVCLAGAFTVRDRWAFAFAMGLKVLTGVTLLAGWLAGLIDRGYVGAVIWLALAGWVYIISTWPEPVASYALLSIIERLRAEGFDVTDDGPPGDNVTGDDR